MTIDFSDLFGDGDEPILNPRDIFLTLNKNERFSFPRDIQTEVLNKWFAVKDQPDNIIKLNVGSGKTVVGLLLLQSSLNERLGPALYVTPDKQLAQQVMSEAKALGILVTDDPRDSGYIAGEKICVINVYKLFNGRSVFGVGRTDINIGTVVVDDAHACVSTITEQFRIKLGNTHECYRKIFTALSEDLKGYSEGRFLELQASDPRAYMEVPFWAWEARQSEILRALHDHREDDELKFVYPFIRDVLGQSRCVIGGQQLEIEPYYPATDLVQSFRRAKRRIYMTATLSDDSVIVTHFGADPKNLANPIVPSSSQSMGERMILMPQELNPDLSIADIRKMLSELSKDHNVVVIVPSDPAAKEWKSVADQTLIGDKVPEGVERLRKGHVGLSVLVNRYDGIDLPGNACRVLAVVDLPEVSSFADSIDGQILSGSIVNLKKHVERIEQGMGRGVRSNEDFCAVLLIGSRLISRIRSTEGQAILTPATRAQLNLSRLIARKLDNPTIDEVKSVLLQCVDNKDENWKKASKKALLGLSTDEQLRLDPSKLAMRAAFDFARVNQHEKAMSELDASIDDAPDVQVKAWLLARKAAFQNAVDGDGAQKTLAAANQMEPAVLKPMHGTNYKKITASAKQQAVQLVSNHQSRFMDQTQMRLFADNLCNDLHFKPDSSEIFEGAINDLAWFIGIQGHRPEKLFHEGPDNLWALPNGTFLVIECKNGITSNSGIAKKDAGQLGQSIEWFNARYPASKAFPVMIHPDRNLGQGASTVAEMRIIDASGLEKLRTSIRGFAKQLANPDNAANASEVAKRLSHFELNSDSVLNAFSKPVKT